MTPGLPAGTAPPTTADVVYRSHKIALDPTNKQATALAKAAGTARFAYNWALARWQQQYQVWRDSEGLADDERPPKPSQFSLNRELNGIKREQFPWMLESTKCAPQEAIKALGAAFANAWAGRSRFPTFKKKGQSRDSFTVSVGSFAVDGRRIRVPKIGWIRMREDLRWPEAKLIAVTFSRTAGRWFASISCEVPDSVVAKRPAPQGSVVGVDVGVRAYATSDGELIEVPRHYRAAQARLRRAQRSLSRKRGPDRRTGQKASNNYHKQLRKVARIQARTANARADWLHKTTSDLASRYETVVLEDLHIAGMAKNHHLAMSVLDAGLGEFRRQLQYKTADHGGRLILADRWYPSTRTCSTCKAVKAKRLALSIREWRCENCGTSHHRDINAAINLRDLAASSAVTACGELLSSDALAPPVRQDVSAKQESDSSALTGALA